MKASLSFWIFDQEKGFYVGFQPTLWQGVSEKDLNNFWKTLSRISWSLNDCKVVKLLPFCLWMQRVPYIWEIEREIWGFSNFFSANVVGSHGFQKYYGIPLFGQKNESRESPVCSILRIVLYWGHMLSYMTFHFHYHSCLSSRILFYF